ncbi:VIT family protein [Mobiluncus curtisii]|uniref:Membrane protein n=2 Tax=Mobiluncus curtisii TaxID=2051 RepID=D6ZL36_MOBCV|nr:VIT family protein [Mobiluncus curtisii]ADI67435.1 membrane protein [Mobiluncus curtisii ATCC 43063]QQU08833.1 VIT family protein [Mobiluncus curtisii]SQB65375.1 VIT family [Mobiluncus curtisii]
MSNHLAHKPSEQSREVDEKHDQSAVTSSRLNRLRAAVLGANDGIISTAGVVVGVAAANPENTMAIATAGIAAVVAGALSMAAGEYVSVSTQRDTEKAVVAKERRLIAQDPDREFQGLVENYIEKGLSRATATLVAQEYSAHDPVEAHVQAHYGLSSEEFTSPWAAAFSSAVSFMVGALVPLLAILLLNGPWKIEATFILVMLALALVGWLSAWRGEAPRLRAVIRVMVGGALAMIVTGGVGHFVGAAV